jgi:hypothetical protein
MLKESASPDANRVRGARVSRVYAVPAATPVQASSLADVLAHTRGVHAVDLDFEDATIAVEFDTELVSEADVGALVGGCLGIVG